MSTGFLSAPTIPKHHLTYCEVCGESFDARDGVQRETGGPFFCSEACADEYDEVVDGNGA